MAGAVLKSHVEPTASRAYLARRSVAGTQMFGGIVLNSQVGGLNADAVEAMARVTGGCGRIVWLPTRDAFHEKVSKGRPGPVVAVTEAGVPVAALDAVLEVISAHDLVLASGHVAPPEALAIFARARQAGCRRLLVTHATAPISNYSLGEVAEMVRRGAWVEFSVRNLFSKTPDGTIQVNPSKAARMVEMIKVVGHGSSVLSSDLGDPRYPYPDDGLSLGAEALAGAGLTPKLLEALLRRGPRELLGIGLAGPARS